MKYSEARAIVQGVRDSTTRDVDPSALAEALRLIGATWEEVAPGEPASPDVAMAAAREVFRQTMLKGAVPKNVTLTPS